LLKIKKRKITITGGNCVRGYQNTLGKGFEVTATFMPGSRLEHITRLAIKK
jgi:hypothetical protein